MNDDASSIPWGWILGAAIVLLLLKAGSTVTAPAPAAIYPDTANMAAYGAHAADPFSGNIDELRSGTPGPAF